jgi:hypothetical protein
MRRWISSISGFCCSAISPPRNPKPIPARRGTATHRRHVNAGRLHARPSPPPIQLAVHGGGIRP